MIKRETATLTAWAMMVAKAAPVAPIPNPATRIKSPIILQTQAIVTVINGVLESPIPRKMAPFYQKIIIALELNKKYKTIVKGEPQLGKRGLYPNLSTKGSEKQIQAIGDFIAYANGKNDLIDISNYSNLPIKDFYPLIDKLLEAKLIKICK